VSLPFPSADFPERYEGMLVRLPQTLSVTEHFQLGRFGQVVVSSEGRLEQPTNVFEPGPQADALQAANNLNRLIIDDDRNNQNPDPIVFGRNGSPLSASNTLRGGDTATGIIGVMTYTWAGNSASGNAYRVRPINAMNGFVEFEAANPRPTAAPVVPPGSVRVAGMNLLNFFNTFDGLPDTVDNCTNGVAGAATDCRGADTQAEFDRQWPKTVAAILGSKADIIGVIEIENDGYGPASAIRFLVDRLNTPPRAPGTYAFIDVDARTNQVNALGTDAIKVGLIYKAARVIPIGTTAALNSVEFVNGGDSGPRNRPALAQAFEEFGTGARFVVSVNHFKSKGSECDAPDANDGQGNCNIVRRNAADELTAWLAADPAEIGDPDVLILGDLNSYAMEGPISRITATGYENLVPAFGGGHSYVFDGQWGSLDHALASETLRPQVTGAADWFINADEPSVLDYNTDFKSAGQIASLYASNEFRVADHNPLLVDLALEVESDTSAKISGGGEIVLASPAGTGAGDIGSITNFALSAQFKKGTNAPQGNVNVIVRATESDGVHVYQVKTTSLSTLLRDPGTGQGTIVGKATISDITDPSAPVTIDMQATARVTVDDNGEPGAFTDSVGITILSKDGTLWFSSRWDGSKTVNQQISEGNVQTQ
jgi:predicted extracellular nuclease